jgi:hypothetical protein
MKLSKNKKKVFGLRVVGQGAVSQFFCLKRYQPSQESAYLPKTV